MPGSNDGRPDIIACGLNRHDYPCGIDLSERHDDSFYVDEAWTGVDRVRSLSDRLQELGRHEAEDDFAEERRVMLHDQLDKLTSRSLS